MTNKPWISPWLEKACDRKNRLYYKYIKPPTTAIKTEYMKLKKFVEKHIKKAKSKYYADYFNKYSSDSRKQWQAINTLISRRKSKTTITKLVVDDKSVTSSSEITNIFNNYFCQIANKLKNNIASTPHNPLALLKNRVKNTIYLQDTTPSEIHVIIRELNNK